MRFRIPGIRVLATLSARRSRHIAIGSLLALGRAEQRSVSMAASPVADATNGAILVAVMIAWRNGIRGGLELVVLSARQTVRHLIVGAIGGTSTEPTLDVSRGTGGPEGDPLPSSVLASASVEGKCPMRLLLLSPGDSYRTGDFLTAAEALGGEVVVASDVPSAVPGAVLAVPFDDPEAAARSLMGALGVIDGVVGTDGNAVAVAAAVARQKGRSANSAASLTSARHKHLQRAAAAAAGVLQPAFRLVVGRDTEGWSDFPAVVKPVDRSGSQGVLRADSPAYLIEAIDRVQKLVGGRAPLLVEQFVAGIEVVVEGLLRNGHLEVIAIFDKPDTPTGPTFPETLLVAPARLDAKTTEHVVRVAERATEAIGLTEGPVHVECKVDGSDVWFIELAARTIGGLCSRSLNHGGVSLEELVILHATGMPLPNRDLFGATGVLMLPVLKAGRVAAVHGVEAARAVEGVTEVVVSVGVGEEVLPLPEGDRYAGFVFARAETADVVEAALRRAWAKLEVDITASSEGSAAGHQLSGQSCR